MSEFQKRQYPTTSVLAGLSPCGCGTLSSFLQDCSSCPSGPHSSHHVGSFTDCSAKAATSSPSSSLRGSVYYLQNTGSPEASAMLVFGFLLILHAHDCTCHMAPSPQHGNRMNKWLNYDPSSSEGWKGDHRRGVSFHQAFAKCMTLDCWISHALFRSQNPNM